jgi:hypothetical protein
MGGLKIRIFKDGAGEPETTITIPLVILRFATRLMPKQAVSAIEEYGIDLNQIVELSQQKDVHGTLVEIDRHKKNEKVVIAIE